jgi:hypothetical protein
MMPGDVYIGTFGRYHWPPHAFAGAKSDDKLIQNRQLISWQGGEHFRHHGSYKLTITAISGEFFDYDSYGINVDGSMFPISHKINAKISELEAEIDAGHLAKE